MASRENYFGKAQILQFIEEAKELVTLYDKENERKPKGHYDYKSVDEVALRLLESSEGIFLTGIKLDGDNITLYGNVGSICEGKTGDGKMIWDVTYAAPTTVTYCLENFRGTTIARFAKTLCGVLARRKASRGELSKFMMPTVPAFAGRTKREVSPYTGLPPA